MELLNWSPYAVESLVVLDPRGEERLLVVVKATFDLMKSPPPLDEKQAPILLADEYLGEPGRSSLKYAGETALFKPGTDVVLIGAAYPGGSDRTQTEVLFRVGNFQKTVRVFGERRWEKKLLSYKPTPPEPFDRIGLIWERAFGGTDESIPGQAQADARNPVGVGFRAPRSKLAAEGAKLPNLEDPMHLVRGLDDRPEPAGFGFIAPNWEPRRSKAGTYDEAWRKARAPLLPSDFNPGFHQMAPASQILPAEPPAGTPVELINAAPTGRLAFGLPRPPLRVSIKHADGPEPLAMKLDTLVVDGEAAKLYLTWRGNVSVHNKVYAVEWIEVTDDRGP